MLSWLIRLILIVSGAIAEWFVARDALNFAVIQGVVALLLGAMIVFALAFWPAHWSQFLNNRFGRNPSKARQAPPSADR